MAVVEYKILLGDLETELETNTTNWRVSLRTEV